MGLNPNKQGKGKLHARSSVDLKGLLLLAALLRF